MNSKTKHRLLGLLVLIGLAVIIFPFLQNGRDVSPDTASIKEPAFPDQSSKLTQSSQDQEQIPTMSETATSTVLPTPAAVTTASSDQDAESPSAPEEMKSAPDDTIKNDHPADDLKAVPPVETVPDNHNDNINTNSSDNKDSSDNTKASALKSTASSEATTVKKEVTSKKTIQASKKVQIKHFGNKKLAKKTLAQKTVKNNDLFNIQDPAWVIQVGSFKTKASALKVVNHLRLNGYKAFIQQFAAGDDTRVFIGPENQQSKARSVADDLQNRMKMHGMVISFQPLSA